VLLARPHVRSPGEEDGFGRVYRSIGDHVVVRGNLVPDAHLVALMRQYGVDTIVSHDRDFRKFAGVRVRDPFG
jgi:predicted nucleic acid-binding protein